MLFQPRNKREWRAEKKCRERRRDEIEIENRIENKIERERRRRKINVHASLSLLQGIGNCLKSRERKENRKDIGKIVVSEGAPEIRVDPVPPAER
ncbi:hypothetical protein K1719_026041 [Acacia pycnantha]|nr:hypothetical protein K1719_026041 [Acacia pycnantha]